MGAHPSSLNQVVATYQPVKPIKTAPHAETYAQTKYTSKPRIQVQKPPERLRVPESSNADKAFIYARESGNNPNAVNSIGCRGLGQACPGSKLPCGNDYACQDKYFSKYAIDRYGSWSEARKFWEQNHWW